MYGRPYVTPALTLRPSLMRVAELVASGKSNKEIAFALGLSKNTVTQYVSRAMVRLHLLNRAHLAAWFVDTQKGPVKGPPETSLG